MIRIFSARPGSAIAALCIALAVLALPACNTQKPAAKVEGKVVYRGKPVTEGAVTFHSKQKGIAAVATLDAAGNFAFAAPLEYGTYAVCVTPPAAEPGDPRTGRTSAKAKVNVPPRARDLMTSGLAYEVNQASHAFTVELTD